MIRTNFYQILSKGNGKDNGPIYLRVKGLDKRLNLSTGINETSKDWDKKKERFKPRHGNAFILNQRLEEMEKKVLGYFEQCSKKNEQITSEKLKKFLNGKDKPKDTLIQTFDQFISHHSSSHANGTLKQYRSTKAKLIQFLQATLNQSDTYLDQLSYGLLTKFKMYLEQHYKNHPNTVNKDLTRLKAVIHWVIKMDWLKEDPFKNYTSTTVPTVKCYLSLAEISKIEQLEISNATKEMVRDAFLLMCYTGLSYSDMKTLKNENIQVSINGSKVLRFSRNKTNEYCIVPLIDEAKELIGKYSNHPRSMAEGCVIPMISNQKMNDYLKEIGDELEITKRITCHVARHSFATNSLELGIPIETVSKALGHRSIKTTQVYARITETKLNHDYQLFANGFKQMKMESTRAFKTQLTYGNSN